MQTILVTGGAGYIGSHTITELLGKTDVRVVSIDNFSNSTTDTYGRVKSICDRQFETINIDLCDLPALEQALSHLPQVDGIIHFAAFKSVPESMTEPELYYHNNIASLNNLFIVAKKRNIRNFIFSSSCSVYGNSRDLPVTEDSPLQKAESPYGHSKQIGEEMIRFFAASNPGFHAVILRYFNPVGAHMSGLNGEMPRNRPNNLVPIITQTAVGKNHLTVFGNDYPTRDGSCIRDYIHVSDIADAHVKALNYLIEGRNKEQISLFNLGTGNGVTVLEAIRSFEKVAAMPLDYSIGPRRAGDVVAIYANNSKARHELGWQPCYSLDDMMLSAWKWQQHLEGK